MSATDIFAKIKEWPRPRVGTAQLITVAVIIVVAIVAVYIFQYTQSRDFLEGFWTAIDTQFCKDAAITSMLLYLTKTSMRKYSGYIVITDNVANQGLVMTISTLGRIGKTCKYSGSVVFDDEQIWTTDKVAIEVNVTDGTLKIFSDDGKMLANLTKNHEITNMSKLLDD